MWYITNCQQRNDLHAAMNIRPESPGIPFATPRARGAFALLRQQS